MLKAFWLRLTSFAKKVFNGIRLILKARPHFPIVLESFSKKDVTLAAVFLLVLLTSGSFLIYHYAKNNETGPHSGGEHIEGLVGQPRFINPILSGGSSVDSDLTRIIFAQLLKFDKDLNLKPDLAESLPEISSDQKTFTLKLKQNLKWQDGKPLTADDVVFTINTIQNADFESPLRANWNRVKIEKVDDLTVKFILREISAPFLTSFTLPIIPKHIWEGLPPQNFRLSDYNLQAVGSGPFIVREIKKTSDGIIKSITLRPNENYHGSKPYLNRVTFKFYNDYDSLLNAFQAKEISSLGYLPFDRETLLSATTRFAQYEIGLPQYSAAFFNIRNPLFSDLAVRQALWLATNRQAIVDEVYEGRANLAFGPILEGNLGFDSGIISRTHTDLNEAAQILTKNGWALDPNTNLRSKNSSKGSTTSGGKKPLQFNLVTNNFLLNVKTAQAIKDQWSKLGADINIIIVSAQELEQQYIRPRNFDVLLFSENTGADPDPFPFWHSTQSRDPGLNLSGFNNPDVDRLLTTARQTYDAKTRIQNYQQFQKMIESQIPAVFLNSAVYVYTVPQKIQGIELKTIILPSDRFSDIASWHEGD